MKLLIDANLSPRVVAALSAGGYDAEHAGDVGLLKASDDEILQWAADHDQVVVAADSDFGMMLAIRGASRPSVLQLRHVADQVPAVHISLLLANLPSIEEALDTGAVVSLSPTRLRIRDLPIG